MKKFRRALLVLLMIFLAWVSIDLYGPWHSNLKKFNAEAIASLETEMWHAYYDRRKVDLYFLLVKMLRTQNGFPFFRAAVSAYWAGRAAIVFKNGTERSDYVRALPYLRSYYGAIRRTGRLNCDVDKMAALELEWWIIHRERGAKGEMALVRAIASTAGELYGVDAKNLEGYARPRARAMIERTEKHYEGGGMQESDWSMIRVQLSTAYRTLLGTLNGETELSSSASPSF